MKFWDLLPDRLDFHTDLAIAAPTRALARRVEAFPIFHGTGLCDMTWQAAAGGREGV